jgi:UDP-4-amino-4,6-dideoxy-N-acetyl-beta-L-altrosamine transaminase
MTDLLAINGGTPVRASLLPYGHHLVNEEDIQAVCKVLRSDWLTTGPMVGQFERAFAETAGTKHAVAVSSGTAALHAAVFALGIKSGDEVITTPMTFAATSNCVLYQGGKPVFADVCRETLNIDVMEIKKAITPRTRAIICVDFSGQPCDMDELLDLATSYNLPVVEDAAHSLGAKYKQQPVGTLAKLTTFSFHPVKHVTTGEGGMVTTNDDVLADRMRIFRNHGMSVDHHHRQSFLTWMYAIGELGYNYRISDVQCALGLSQLGNITARLVRRREIADRYNKAFSSLSEVECPTLRSDRETSWHLYVLRLKTERLQADRLQIFRALRAENIGVNVHYIPVPWHPYYQHLGYQKGNWPTAEAEYERLLTLPLWYGMDDRDIEDTITAVHRVISAYRA